MNLEQQVCSLELAKRIDELGFNYPSHYYWVVPLSNCSDKRFQNDFPRLSEFYENDLNFTSYAAMSVPELGELLPSTINDDGEKYILTCMKVRNLAEFQFGITYQAEEYYAHRRYLIAPFYSKIEADSRASMLILLKEHNYVI